jgi:hypothetical protein
MRSMVTSREAQDAAPAGEHNGQIVTEAEMKAFDFRHMSPRNSKYRKTYVTVASGAKFVALRMTSEEMHQSRMVLYLHVHRKTLRCYVGQSLKPCARRWAEGRGYKAHNQPRIRAAIDAYGWPAFDSYILAFAESKEQLDAAEVECIKAAGGNQSPFVFNLARGGRAGADRSEAIEGVNLATGEWRSFPNAIQAAEHIGARSSVNVRRVVGGDIKSSKGWWFRKSGSSESPPSSWGLGSGKQTTRPVIAVRLSDKKPFTFASVSEAARYVGANSSNVARALKSKTGGTCNGYWINCAASEVTQIPSAVGKAAGALKNGIPVIATNVATGEERRFISGRQAAEALGVDSKNVPAALKGRVKSLGGWRLRYA